jgi:hypothetical protein
MCPRLYKSAFPRREMSKVSLGGFYRCMTEMQRQVIKVAAVAEPSDRKAMAKIVDAERPEIWI